MNRSVIDRPAPSPAIDARIRARRIDVRRSEGRRRLRRLLLLVGITVLALAAWGVTRSPLLDVDEIVVRGATRSGADAVVGASGVERGHALVDVDLGGASDGIRRLPWVADVTIARSWSGTITVDVVERTPVAVLAGSDGRNWLVDAEAVVLAEASGSDVVAGHVVIEGAAPATPGGRVEALPDAVLSLARALDGELRSATAAVVIAESETWIRLHPRPGEVDAGGEARTDGGRIRFGDLRSVDDQVLAAATILDQVELADLDVVDVRVPSNPIVTRVATPVDATDDETDGEGEA